MSEPVRTDVADASDQPRRLARGRPAQDMRGHVMLWSGGIGDFLHYFARLPGHLAANRLTPDELTIVVEATSPANVSGLFQTVLPTVDVRFLPPQIHWTKTNPLINPVSERDRVHRPAYEFLCAFGRVDADWFLPTVVAEIAPDDALLGPLAEPGVPAYGVVSLRDKGLPWWPSADAVAMVRDALTDPVVILGLPDEGADAGQQVEHLPLVQGLRTSVGAEVYVGTDTGLATARELLGLPNVYCISSYWLEDMLFGLGYLDDALLRRSGSVVATTQEELCEALSTRRGRVADAG